MTDLNEAIPPLGDADALVSQTMSIARSLGIPAGDLAIAMLIGAFISISRDPEGQKRIVAMLKDTRALADGAIGCLAWDATMQVGMACIEGESGTKH